MSETMNAEQILERQFLEMRCGLLDLAASFDRIGRAEAADALFNDQRMKLLTEGIKILSGDSNNRAEQLQMLFSDDYVEGWNRQDLK